MDSSLWVLFLYKLNAFRQFLHLWWAVLLIRSILFRLFALCQQQEQGASARYHANELLNQNHSLKPLSISRVMKLPHAF